MAYFSDVFTPATWNAFVNDGGRVTAFRRASLARGAGKVRPGDRLVCYLKGTFTFVGAIEAKSEAATSEEPIWGFTDFPVRVEVSPHVLFQAAQGLDLASLEGKLTFYPPGMARSMVPAYFQGSPRQLKDVDGEAIWRALLARDDGVRPVSEEVLVGDGSLPDESTGRTHSELQSLLAEVGLAVGCSVWIPRSDRQAVGRQNAAIPERLLKELPFLFPGKAQSVVQNIDVIWLQGPTVVAAFEVENTTSIYSGILRMSDLVALLPNISFPMYIVAPNGRRRSVMDEVTRPTFSALHPPLNQKCGFISAEAFRQRKASLGDDTLRHLRPGFIDDLAERF